MGLKVIITGATGMVGEGIMQVCLNSDKIEQILVINRRSDGVIHPKLKEVVLSDFMQLHQVEQEFQGYDACFHCMGITSVGADMKEYKRITQDITLMLGEICSRTNPQLTFVYVSGSGTDETESSRMEWARIKGHTENELAKMSFKNFYAYRPGFIKPFNGLKHSHMFYRYINWMFPAGKLLAPDVFNTMEELGKSMIQLCLQPIDKTIIKGTDIAQLSKKLV